MQNAKDDVMLNGSTGEVHDTIKFVEDGEVTLSNGEVIKGKAGEEIKLKTSFNLILKSFPKIVAMLLKGDDTLFKNLWWEVGSGSEDWKESSLPTPNLNDTGLLKPTFRKKINVSDISYLKVEGDAVSPTPTEKIQIISTFLPGEANGYLREFSIFVGGSATLGSGIPMNRKIHGVIYKTSGIELQRKIHFHFKGE